MIEKKDFTFQLLDTNGDVMKEFDLGKVNRIEQKDSQGQFDVLMNTHNDPYHMWELLHQHKMHNPFEEQNDITFDDIK